MIIDQEELLASKKMHHLIWCCFSVLASVSISFICRILVYKISANSYIRIHFDEFAANFICSVVVMEMLVINYVQHSLTFYYTVLFVFLFLKNLFFVIFELYANPLSFVNLFYAKNRSREFTYLEAASIVIVQLVSTLVGQMFVKNLWLLEDAVHLNAFEEVCLSNLSHEHSLYECFLVEAFGVFICAVVDFIIPEGFRWYTRPLMTVIVIHNLGYITGTWMNPALASAFTFRCEGHNSDWEHVFVYWVAPFVGLFLAWELTYLMSNMFSKKSEAKKKAE